MTFAQQLRVAQLGCLIANGDMLIEHLTTWEHTAWNTDELQHACAQKCAALALHASRIAERETLLAYDAGALSRTSLSGATALKSPPALDGTSVASGSRG